MYRFFHPRANYARDLYAFLGVGKFFANWIKDRIECFLGVLPLPPFQVV